MSNRLIMIPYGKAVLYLTPQEVRDGLRRGKMIRRRDSFIKREKQAQVGHRSPGNTYETRE